jgi:multidrug efflux pump subunit AcrA (membrane-fusion protein)
VAAIAQVTKDEAALSAALGLASTGGTGTPGQGGTDPSAAIATATETAFVTSVDATTTAATSSTSGSGTSGTGGSSTGSSSATSGHTRTVTAQVIALDETNVDAAQAALESAQQDVGDANLISNISGTVGSVTLAVGQSVAAGSPSATPQVVVVGPGDDYQVATTVPVTEVAKVKVGQQALVTPDSSSSTIVGTVTGIGVLGTTSTSTTTYPVTIGIQSTELGPFSGADATVQIVLARATGVTTVPTSAVRSVGTLRTVTVIDGTTLKVVRVTVGTTGTLRTQILSGVRVGQVVSLAEMAAPVPSSSTTGGFGGAGGFAGGTGGFGGTARVGG